VPLFDRTKRVKKAPPGYAPTWKEHVGLIVPTQARDAGLARFMRDEAVRLQREYYRGDGEQPCSSFKTCETAGWVEISEDVISASPDLVSVSVGTNFYQAGMAHPNVEGVRNFVWSRRLGRLLKQDDVFSVPPDRKLRRIAQARFDNQDGLQSDNPDGIPLSWDHVSIGPTGITWSFGPYELGGYLSAGDATVSWSDLKPYLRRNLPFEIKSIRLGPDSSAVSPTIRH
jgi:hypothetical protein